MDKTVSFEFKMMPGYFLTVKENRVYLLKYDGTMLFKKASSFIIHKDKYYKGYSVLECSMKPGYFLRHSYYQLVISRELRSITFMMDSSFLITTVCKYT